MDTVNSDPATFDRKLLGNLRRTLWYNRWCRTIRVLQMHGVSHDNAPFILEEMYTLFIQTHTFKSSITAAASYRAMVLAHAEIYRGFNRK